MVQQNEGQAAQPAIVPLFEGRPLNTVEMNSLLAEDKIDEAQVDEWRARIPEFAKRLGEVSREIQILRVETGRATLGLIENTARALLENASKPIVDGFSNEEPAVADFVRDLVDDVVENLGAASPPGVDPTALYDVNVILSVDQTVRTPVVVETTPSLLKLLGSVENGWSPQGPVRGDFRNISAGSILRANGGYLVLEARDVLNEPGAWRVLVRTLRSKQLEICLLYTSPSPRDQRGSRMPSSA